MRNPFRDLTGSQRLAVSAIAIALVACPVLHELSFRLPSL